MTIEYEGSLYIKLGRKYLQTEIDTAYIEKLQKENAELRLNSSVNRKYVKYLESNKRAKQIVNRLLREFFGMGTLSKEAVDKAKAFVEEL